MKWTQRIGSRLKLHDLHIFLAVAETGSMGKAAERLNISQPSVSKAIADMEHVMQVRLFDRTGHGVETTPYGLAIVRRGTNAFDELRQALRDIEILADPTGGEVSIGCPEAIASGFLGAVLTRFSLQFPRVVVNVEQANNVIREYQLLRDRQVDLLLGSITRPFAEEDLDVEIIYEDRPYITTGANNSLAGRRKVELAELLNEKWVLPGVSILRTVLDETFEANGLASPKVSVRSYSVHQRISLLATGRFVSADSGSVLRYNTAASSLKILPIDVAFRAWPVAVVTLKNRTLNPVVKTFIKCVREVAAPLVA